MSHKASSNQTDGVLNRIVAFMIRNPSKIYRGLFYVGLSYFLVIAIFPIYWLSVIAVTPPLELSEVWFLPKGFNLGVFIEVFRTVPLHRYMFNSFVISLVATAIILVVGSLAGYVFGRMEFPGRRSLLLLLLTISYFPGVTYLIPLYRLFSGNISVFGIQFPRLLNTPFGLIIPFTAFFLPFAVYVLSIFYSQIPDGLEDAARIEGTTRLGALFHVIMPLSAPGVATAGVITFIFMYNEFFFSFILTNGDPDNWSPMLWGVLTYQTQYGAQYHLMAAASLVAIVPVAILVFTAQKHIISGLTAGGMKG